MRARSRSRAAILAFGLVACRPSFGSIEVAPEPEPAARPASVEPPAPAWAPLPSTIRWPSGALAIELPPGDPAPWLLPPFEPGHDHPLDRISPLVQGQRIALARSEDLLLASDRDEGLLGTIALPPDIVWIGLGGDDRILAADSHGRVHAAATVAEALERGLEPTGAVLRDVTGWDAAGERMIAVAGSAVMVSEDGGRTFRSTEPAPRGSMASAVVRADGVMVALSQADRATAYVSRDGGRSWRRSSWHPETLWREGAWIMGWSGDQMGVLSSDGRSWAGGFDRFVALEGYLSGDSDFFSSGPAPRTGRWRTPTDPPAPPPPARPLRGFPRDAGISGGIEGGILSGLLGTIEAPCSAGLVCLHGTVGDPPAPSRLDLRIFGDARCEDEEASPCPLARWRAPHLGVFDHATRRLVLGRMPRVCAQVEAAGARGLGLVSCRYEDTTSLITVEPDGTAHVELELSHAAPDASYVMMAEDGTVLVPEVPTCEQWARAWVRRPVAPGHPEAWTQLELPGARTWRPVGRGYAVAVADHPGGGGRIGDLWLAGPGLAPEPVVEGIPVLVAVTDVRVDDGRVSLHAERWQVVRHDAGLAEVELPSRDRVVNGVTVSRARPWLGCGEEGVRLE